MPTPRKVKKIDIKYFRSNPLKGIKPDLDIKDGISEFRTSDDYRYKRHSCMNPDGLSLLIGKLNINSNECKVDEEEEVERGQSI
jgi:hypothetical protein